MTPGELGTIENSGALILAARILADHPDLRIRIAHPNEDGYAVEIADLTEPILCETRPILREALLAALVRLDDEWLHP